MFDGLMFDGCEKRQKSAKKIRGKHYLEKEVFGRSRRAAKGVRHPPKPPGVDTEVSDL